MQSLINPNMLKTRSTEQSMRTKRLLFKRKCKQTVKRNGARGSWEEEEKG